MGSAYLKDQDVAIRLERAGIKATTADARILRRAERTLQSWAEWECGNGNDHASWSIERDEATGKPYKCIYPHKGAMRRYPVADRERGALRRVAEVCKRLGCHFYHQTDPRGAGLYVSTEPLTDQNYNRGVCCAV